MADHKNPVFMNDFMAEDLEELRKLDPSLADEVK